MVFKLDAIQKQCIQRERENLFVKVKKKFYSNFNTRKKTYLSYY